MSQYQGGYDSGEETESDGEVPSTSDDFKQNTRTCTDIPCCLVWVLCLVALVGVYGYGLANGNPKRLHHGLDSFNRVCGVDPGVELKPMVYFCPPKTWEGGHLTAAGFNFDNPVCVAACPVGNNMTDAVVPPEILECAPNFTTTAYKTTNQMNYCMPDTAIHKAAQEGAASVMDHGVRTIMNGGESIYKGWPVYIVIFFVSMFLGYAYMCCLKVFAQCMVWLAIIISFLCLGIAGIWLIMKAPEIGTNTVASEQFGEFTTGLAYVGGVLCALASIGVLCLMCCCYSQIEYAILAVRMTTDVMFATPTMLIAPLVKMVAKFIVGVILLIGFIWLLSVAKPHQVLGTQVREFKYESYEYGLLFFYAFMYFWIMSFMTALYQYSIAYVTADYYYSIADGGERSVACCGLMEALCVGFTFHSGSFAFGSFIIAIFAMIQRVIEYIERSNKGNPVVKVVACCCYCCVTCCKSCAEFINKNAYIGIAVKGYNFCHACKKALHIMIEMAGAMTVLNGATYIFQLAGLLMITALSVLIAHLFCQISAFTDPMSSTFIPNPPLVVIIAGLLGFAMAKIFMDVFDMVSDTLMYCFGLDKFDGNNPRTPPEVRAAFAEAEGKCKSQE